MTGRSFHEYSTLYLHWIFASIPVTIIKSVQGSRFDWEWYGQIERVVYWLEVFVQLHTVAADLHPSSYWHNIDWLMISSSSPRFSPVSPPAPSLPSSRSPGVPWLGLVRSVNSNRIIPRITAGMFLQRKTLWKLWAVPVPCFQGQYFASTKKLTSDPL